MQFTSESIATLSLPAGKTDHIEFDEDMPGFGVRLRAGGKRVWLVQYRADGRQRRETLGDVRKVSLKDARAAARKRFAAVTLGNDPQAEKQAKKARAALIFGTLADRYLGQKKGVVRPNTYVADRRYLEHHLRSLRGLPIDAVNRRLVSARLSEIAFTHGATSGARARQSLSAFFAWLIREGIVSENPVIGTSNPGEHLRARERVLTNEELRLIWNACAGDDFGRIIRLLMLTGARRDEIGGLRWTELKLDDRQLQIPGTRTKNHHPLKLTLPIAAVEILRTVSQRPGRELLFGGGQGGFVAWSYATLALHTRIAEANGGPTAAWRIHDIRRTVATGMAGLGVLPHVVETVINHRSGHKAGVAGIYNRANYEPEVARALDMWATHLDSIVSGTDRKIIPLGVVAA